MQRFVLAIMAWCLVGIGAAHAAPAERRAFTITQRFEIAAPPKIVFRAATGDISRWWDHTFSDQPYALVLEAKPGGRFWERFDAGNSGALHAQVIYVQAPNVLRMEGPLGLSGKAVTMVTTYDLEAIPGGTAFTVTVNAAGQLAEADEGLVTGVWQHFIQERLKPYVETGCYRHPGRACPALQMPQ